MNAINYDKLMTEQIKSADKNSRLLLHCCCAPCSSACLERLKDYFKITVLFYNPNIEDAEYARRKSELERFIALTGCADITECARDTAEFDRAVKGLEDQPEGGRRCAACFKLRLSKTAEIAERGNYGFFATTLTISPLKNAALINGIGEKLQEGRRAKWLYSDFKKRDGYLQSIRLSEKYGLYRQDFCGCRYSLRNDLKNS